MTYAIETGIAPSARKVQAEKGKRGRPPGSKYPFADMQPGDSFLVPDAWKFALWKYRAYQKPGTYFKSHKTPDGVRIFCLAEEKAA